MFIKSLDWWTQISVMCSIVPDWGSLTDRVNIFSLPPAPTLSGCPAIWLLGSWLGFCYSRRALFGPVWLCFPSKGPNDHWLFLCGSQMSCHVYFFPAASGYLCGFFRKAEASWQVQGMGSPRQLSW